MHETPHLNDNSSKMQGRNELIETKRRVEKDLSENNAKLRAYLNIYRQVKHEDINNSEHKTMESLDEKK